MDASRISALRHHPKSLKKRQRTSAIFQTRNFKTQPSKLSTATNAASSSPTKYDLTSKPQGVQKRQLEPKATRSRKKAGSTAPSKKHNALAHEFDEVSEVYRSTVTSNAESLLLSAHEALLTRLESSIDNPSTPAKDKTTGAIPRPPFVASSASDDEEGDDEDTQPHQPSLIDLCRSHNADMAALQAPFANYEVEHRPTAAAEQALASSSPKRMGDSMEEFRRTVAAYEADMTRLEKEWEDVQHEISQLARAIFGDDDDDDDAETPRLKQSGVDAALVRQLKRLVVETADEFEGRLGEVQEAEMALQRRQERFLADTIRTMGDL